MNWPQRIECFWMEALDEAEVRLRRFVFSKDGESCSSRWGYHNASSAPIGREAFPRSNGYQGDHTGTLDHADPRWPRVCSCGYVFAEADQWQVCRERLYRRVDTGDVMTIAEAPAGAMYDAPWYAEHGFGRFGADGYCLHVKTPGGEWGIDCQSRDGGWWTREGAVPRVTARPSILMHTNGYHAFLTDGVLELCC